MKCFAIWYKPKSETQPARKLEVELHLNLWRFSSNNQFNTNYYLDIGLKLNNLKDTKPDSIRIYLPFKVKKGEIVDIGNRLRNEHLVAAIFNENYSVQVKHQSDFITLLDDNNIIFNIHELKDSIEIDDSKYDGSVIKINIIPPENDLPLYFRIRVMSNELKSLYHQYKPINSWLDHYYTITELVDFRINEGRVLGSDLSRDMQNEGIIDFKSIDFFNMAEYSYDYISSNQPLHRSRRLEKGVWDSYVDNSCNCENVIAYQLKWERQEGKSLPGMNAFLKYKFLKDKLILAIRFVLILIGIGIIGGLLASLMLH
jgi:hypothetical protein